MKSLLAFLLLATPSFATHNAFVGAGVAIGGPTFVAPVEETPCTLTGYTYPFVFCPPGETAPPAAVLACSVAFRATVDAVRATACTAWNNAVAAHTATYTALAATRTAAENEALFIHLAKVNRYWDIYQAGGLTWDQYQVLVFESEGIYEIAMDAAAAAEVAGQYLADVTLGVTKMSIWVQLAADEEAAAEEWVLCVLAACTN